MNKFLTAKEQANKEGLSVWEVECHIDVELFLEGQARWEEDSPHCLIILHEMFQYALEQGQKEAECMIHQGCQHGLLKPGPKVDVSAIWLVGPQTSREEFKSLYYEVYQLQRLPGSPTVELEQVEELVAEVVSSLEDCQGWKGGNCHGQWRNLIQSTSSLHGAKPPGGGERTSPGKGASLR